MFRRFDLYFTEKKKKFFSVICGIAAVLWIILWAVFPMEFYSLFFMSSFGSNVFLVFMELVLMVPLNMLFSKVLKANISMSVTLAADIICMTAVAYTFSIFRYSQIWWVVLSAFVHLIIKLFAVGKPYEDKDVVIPIIKRKPLSAVLTALAYTAALDGIFLVLMYSAVHTFRGY